MANGISDSLLRLSVGIEHPDDLLRDIGGGLERAACDASAAVARSPQLAPGAVA